jgi:hypothetical protein
VRYARPLRLLRSLCLRLRSCRHERDERVTKMALRNRSNSRRPWGLVYRLVCQSLTIPCAPSPGRGLTTRAIHSLWEITLPHCHSAKLRGLPG